MAMENLSLVENLRGVFCLGALPPSGERRTDEGAARTFGRQAKDGRDGEGENQIQNFSGSMDSGSHLVKWQRLSSLSIGTEK